MESTNAVGAVAESTQNFLKVPAVVVQGVNTIFGPRCFWGPVIQIIEKRVCLNTANPLEPESSNRCGPTHRKIPRGGISLGVPAW